MCKYFRYTNAKKIITVNRCQITKVNSTKVKWLTKAMNENHTDDQRKPQPLKYFQLYIIIYNQIIIF